MICVYVSGHKGVDGIRGVPVSIPARDRNALVGAWGGFGRTTGRPVTGSGVWRLGRPRGTRSGAQNGVLSPAPNVNPDSEYRLPGRLQSEVRRPGLP